ncbi:hypothetical protein [Methylobacterium sp. 22177]|uniref:hypothetical protein n=1 Tax=Methylobacterium sp. 22177 TaxID=3453885 RepID=UPI003F8419EE
MTIPLRTRSDLKAAGRNMAIESVDAVARHLAGLTPEEMEDTARIDAMTARMTDAAVKVARTYLDSGIPADWVRAFLNAFHRTATARLDGYSLAARTANTNAGASHAVD